MQPTWFRCYATPMHFGFGRREISSCYEHGMAMMGWGMRYNQALGVAAPLFARAVVVSDEQTGDRFAWCTIETLLVTQGLWFGVVDTLALEHPELGLGERNVVMTATHTHSGPSGFGHHFWINLNAPGWSPMVYEGLRAAVVGAIRDAAGSLQPGSIRFEQTQVPTADGIAFNRSWFAYNRNRDVTPVSYERRDEATDRVMSALVFEDAEGKPAGMWNWFATHGTTVHADNTQLHPDHKGLAAMALEADGLDVVFNQECCGDVTPNYRWDTRRKHTIGRYDDDFASAQHVADVQARHARALAQERADSVRVQGGLRVRSRYVDFSAAPVAPRFTHDGSSRTSTPARLGLSMAEGTAEGPGPLRQVRWATQGIAQMRSRFQAARGRKQDPKLPFIDLAGGTRGRLAGLVPMRRMPALDETFGWVARAMRSGGVHEGSWVPQTVPLHLIQLGPVAIAAIPFEMTTVAGRRLRQTLRETMPGVQHVVLSPYANAYIGYLTTFEEYQVQHYEAGYTLFGPHTLGALRTALTSIANDHGGDTQTMGPAPWRPPTDILERIRFERPWTV